MTLHGLSDVQAHFLSRQFTKMIWRLYTLYYQVSWCWQKPVVRRFYSYTIFVTSTTLFCLLIVINHEYGHRNFNILNTVVTEFFQKELVIIQLSILAHRHKIYLLAWHYSSA
jgi:hypothetical protein